MKNKLTAAVVLALTALGTTSVYAASAESEEADLLGGNFTSWMYLGNERMFRGNSETQNSDVPAVQGLITWTHADTSIYFGYWAATVKFDIAPSIYGESGPFIGKSGTIGDTGINYNILLWHYIYHEREPGHFDYTELYLQANKQFGKWNLAAEITPTTDDWFGVEDMKGIAYSVTPTYGLDDGWSISATLGVQDFTGSGEERSGVKDWSYGDIGVSKTFNEGWKVDLRYHDTSLSGSAYDTSNIWKEHYVLAVSRSM
jgi:uncharacterized protein (TIGR02001 family)